jgi:hypothetical protein
MPSQILYVNAILLQIKFIIYKKEQYGMKDTKFTSILDEITTAIPKYRKIIFKTIIIGLLIGEKNKCIAGIYRFFEYVMFSEKITRRRFYEFLGSGKISFSKIWDIIFRLLGDSVVTEGRILCPLDDTTYGKSGRKIAGCDIHYDHAAKINSSKYIHGHCRVVLGIQMFVHGRWACLPVRQYLYRLKKSVDSKKFKTKLEIAGQMVKDISLRFSSPILLICDSWFGNKSLVKQIGEQFGKTIHVLTKLRVDSILYDFPEEAKEKRRGRKRKYGKKLPKLSILAGNLERFKDKFFIYGKNRDCEYSTFNCIHKSFGREVKVVIVHLRKGNFFPIVSTDTTLSAKHIIEYYSARWKIESGFKELKHELGALDNQARNENSVENHFEFACIAKTAAWIYASHLTKAPERKFKTLKSNSYAFADIRRKIRNEYYDSFNFSAICSESGKYVKNFILSMISECSA